MNEKPFSGKYWNSAEKGAYTCAACGNKLFSSKAKFDPGTGWASFLNPIDPQNVEVKNGAEVVCRKCGGRLGEMAGEKDKHYRINSMALDFEKAEGSALLGNLKDELQGRAEDKLKEESEKKDASAQNPTPAWSLKNVLVLLGGVALGAGLGASAATVYNGIMCQTGASQTRLPIVAPYPTSTPTKPAGGVSVPPKPTGTPAGSSVSTTTPGSGAVTTTPGSATSSDATGI